jgi:hypothetical protein
MGSGERSINRERSEPIYVTAEIAAKVLAEPRMVGRSRVTLSMRSCRIVDGEIPVRWSSHCVALIQRGEVLRTHTAALWTSASDGEKHDNSAGTYHASNITGSTERV